MTLHHILFQSSSKNASILSKTVWSLISTGIIAIAVYNSNNKNNASYDKCYHCFKP
jgi:uncharacterized membrane protein